MDIKKFISPTPLRIIATIAIGLAIACCVAGCADNDDSQDTAHESGSVAETNGMSNDGLDGAWASDIDWELD